MLCREARDAELSARASLRAEALFGEEDSLVVADLRLCESESLNNMATQARGVEREALISRACKSLLSVITLLLRRLTDNTLLPGTIRDEELDYAIRVKAATKKEMNKPPPPPAL